MADVRRSSFIARGIAAVALTLAATGMLAAPASAHAQLVSTDPADGATLSAAPSTVTFTFDEALLADTETISINDENGNVVASQQAKPDGAKVSVPWPADLASGTFQVAYRVVSGDGHPVTGAIMFTIGGSASASASASSSAASSSAASSSAASSSAASSSAASSSAASSSASPAPTADPSPAPAESGSSGVAVALVILGALVVLALVVIVAVTMIRRRR